MRQFTACVITLVSVLVIIITPASAQRLVTVKNVVQNNTRIVGGRPASPGLFPFQVAIYLQRVDGTYFCGGTLISSQWIMTAGHCIENAQSFTIYLGSLLLEGEDPDRVTVASVRGTLHPEYDPATASADIGLINLHLPVTLGPRLRPAILPSSALQPDQLVRASGWGQIGDSSDGISNSLNYAQLVSIPIEECSYFYSLDLQNVICASGNYNEGICIGDTGGPLSQTQRTGDQIVFGISTFWSRAGCESTDPSGFTDVFMHKDWITEVSGVH